MPEASDFEFRTCPRCNGYGVLDSGQNCSNCGGSGSHGLRSTDGVIGSGDVIIERSTGRQISLQEFNERMRAPGVQPHNPQTLP